MSRLLVLLILLSLWCSSSFAQEKTPASSNTEDRREKMKEGNNDSGIVWVKDPADWRRGLGEPVYSGPQPGETLKGCSIASLTRSTGDERVDPVALAKGKPHIMIFIDDSDIYEGLGAWHRAVGSIAENSRTGLAASAVILGEGPTFEKQMGQARNKYESFYRWLNLFFQVGYSRDGRDGPGGAWLPRGDRGAGRGTAGPGRGSEIECSGHAGTAGPERRRPRHAQTASAGAEPVRHANERHDR